MRRHKTMYLKKTKQKNGRINLSFVHGFRDPKTKKVKQRVVENLGYVDEYTHLYDDPVAHFKEVLLLRNKEIEEEKRKKEIYIGSVPADEFLELNEDAMKLLGMLPLSSIYHELELNKFFINRQRSLSVDYSLNDIMQLLVYTRILSPGSKRHSFKQKDKLIGTYDFEEHDVYRALDYFDKFKDDLLVHIHESIRMRYRRKTNIVFYDVTNFYFEIDKKACAKTTLENPLYKWDSY